MTHNDYLKLIEFARIGDQLIAVNNHIDLINNLVEGEMCAMKMVNPRDIKLHRAYFAFNRYIYNYLPEVFRKKIHISKFYKFLQTMKGEYDILFKFKDGRELIEYHSISFSKMNENTFRDYIKEQIPFIYENLIREFYDEITAEDIINNIEQDFEKFLTKLYAK